MKVKVLTFKQKVLAVVSQIPRGRTLTYKEVARRAGSPHAYRAAGNILKRNVNPAVPCHRVICSSGDVGKYNRGKARKIRRLRSEGVRI